MATLATCLIVKNEEDKLARCLACANSFSDEIIVTDTGSTDRTVEIAHAYTDRVYSFPWCDDFAAARNDSYSHATADYVMWMDADNYLDEEACRKLACLKGELDGESSVFLLLGSRELGRARWDHRIVRRDPSLLWENRVHEQLPVRDPVRFEPILIRHLFRGPVDPNYPRLLRAMPQERVFSEFWFCAQAYHDFLRCGFREEAQVYRERAAQGDWCLEEYASPAEDVANILFYYGYCDEALWWYEYLVSSREFRQQCPADYERVVANMMRCRRRQAAMGAGKEARGDAAGV